MEQRRSLLEWIFDTAAAIGIVVALFSIFLRGRYPSLDVAALVYAGVGIAVFAGGVAGSKWCKQKRLSALISNTPPRDRHAN